MSLNKPYPHGRLYCVLLPTISHAGTAIDIMRHRDIRQDAILQRSPAITASGFPCLPYDVVYDLLAPPKLEICGNAGCEQGPCHAMLADL